MTNKLRCAMTGIPVTGSADAVWDDGEWISWEYINDELHKQDLRKEFPKARIEVIQTVEELISAAAQYKALTGRYLQIWGELGELYAEIKHGLVRHKPGAQGSDGLLKNDHVEVKTISPEKAKQCVHVKRSGNFNKLLVVRISKNYEFESRILDRKLLKKGKGKLAKVSWENIPNE